MKRTLKSKLLLFFLAMMSLFILGGCTLGESLDDYMQEYNLTAQVTYYANGGEFENKKTQKNIYYEEGNKALNIVEETVLVSGSLAISRKDYVFAGWYHIQTTANGELIYEDEEAGTFKLGKEVDFSKPLSEGDQWNIAAKWATASKVIVQLVCDEGQTLVSADDATKSFKNGDQLRTISYSSTGKAIKPSGDPVKIKDSTHTFAEYYVDEACTTPVKWNLDKQDEDVTIYAKYITGNWEIVKENIDLVEMFANTDATKKYWILNDIDFENSGMSMSELNFEIQGNGHTIINVSVTKGQIGAGESVSMFGKIAQTAKIENLIFENVTVSYTAKTAVSFSTYLVFTELVSGATINNVEIKGNISFTVNGPNGYTISNNLENNLCFGGYETDSTYLTQSANAGFKVTGDITVVKKVDGIIKN